MKDMQSSLVLTGYATAILESMTCRTRKIRGNENLLCMVIGCTHRTGHYQNRAAGLLTDFFQTTPGCAPYGGITLNFFGCMGSHDDQINFLLTRKTKDFRMRKTWSHFKRNFRKRAGQISIILFQMNLHFINFPAWNKMPYLPPPVFHAAGMEYIQFSVVLLSQADCFPGGIIALRRGGHR